MKTWLVVFFICAATLLVAHTIGTLHSLRSRLKLKTELGSRLVYSNITKPMADLFERESTTKPNYSLTDLYTVERAVASFEILERLTADGEPSIDTLFNNRTADVYRELTNVQDRLRHQFQSKLSHPESVVPFAHPSVRS